MVIAAVGPHLGGDVDRQRELAGWQLGGLLALLTIGELQDPATAAAGGLLAGAVIGGGQWLALRSDGIGRRWIAYTAVAMGAGAATAAVVTGAGTELGDLVVSGIVTGAVVGAAQSALLGSGRLAWTGLTAASWGLGWLVSATVLAQQADSGFYVFGSSGAIVVTVLTGFALRRLLAFRPAVVA